MRTALFSAIVLCLFSVTSGGLSAGPPARNFVTGRMSGAQEVPPVNTPAQGAAVFNLNPRGNRLRVHVIVTRISNVFAAHIHSGAAGTNGPVLATLFSGPIGGGPMRGVLAKGTIIRGITPLPPTLGANLNRAQRFDALIRLMRTGNTYVNVHTLPGVPSGEIRGQIKPRP